jgi:hypothetical protein
MIRHREEILERQLVQERIAQAAMELYASACVLSRRDADLASARAPSQTAAIDGAVADLFLMQTARRIRKCLGRLGDNEDEQLRAAAAKLVGLPAC